MRRAPDHPRRLLRSHGRAILGAARVVKEQHRVLLGKNLTLYVLRELANRYSNESLAPPADDPSFSPTRHNLMNVVVLCSGGMDSVTALHWAKRGHTVVAAVSFDYGAKHN